MNTIKNDQAISLSNHIQNLLGRFFIKNYVLIQESDDKIMFSLDENIVKIFNIHQTYQFFEINIIGNDVWLSKNNHDVNLSHLARLDGVNSINKNTKRVDDSLNEIVFSMIDYWRCMVTRYLSNR